MIANFLKKLKRCKLSFNGIFPVSFGNGENVSFREFVLGTMFCPMMLCCLFMCIMGGNAIHFDMEGVSSIAAAMNENVSYTLFALLEQFPFATATSLAAVLLIFIFLITSVDSSTFVCAMMTDRGIREPPTMLKVTWGVFEGVVTIILLYISGLSAVQSVSSAFPFFILCLFIAAALVKSLRKDIK